MKKQSTFVIEDESSLASWMKKSENNKMLLVFDVHLLWSGNCEILTPCFDQMYIQYENAEERFACLSMEGQKFANAFASLVTISDSCMTTLDDILMDGEAKVLVNNATKETTSSSFGCKASSTNIIEKMKVLLQKKRDGCAPLFLAVKDREIISIVQGADYPALQHIVNEHIPKLSSHHNEYDNTNVEEGSGLKL